MSESSLAVVLSIVIMINLFGGIVGGTWLLLAGGLRLIIIALCLAIFMPWVYSLASIPNVGLGYLAVKTYERSKDWAIPLLVLAALYEKFILTYWVMWVFGYFVDYVGRFNAIPLVLAAHSVVMSPLSYMAKSEPEDSPGTSLALFYAQFVFLFLVIVNALKIPFEIYIVLLGIVYLFFAIYPAIMICTSEVENAEQNRLSDGPKGDFPCGKCGALVSENAKYCKNCGKDLNLT